LSKEKSDLIFNVQEKDRKIREIKVRTEQIDSEKKKLDEALRKKHKCRGGIASGT